MSALLQALISRFGEPVARKLLGIEKQQQNPKYAISLGNINLNPVSMIQRAGLNQGIKSLMGGNMSSLMGPAALLGGAVMLGRAFDPTRPGSRNYNPNLSGQIDYLSGIGGMIGRNPSSGLMQYGPDSVLRGQNVMSMFGTNDYEKQLQNKIDYFNKQKDKKGFLTNYQKSQKNKASQELENLTTDEFDQVDTFISPPSFSGPTMRDVAGDGGGGRMSASDFSDDTAGTPFRRGGIASL